MLCIKVIIDGFRSHRVSLSCSRDPRANRPLQEQAEPHVGSFLEAVKQMYANTKSVVEREFGVSGAMRPPVGCPYSTESSRQVHRGSSTFARSGYTFERFFGDASPIPGLIFFSCPLCSRPTLAKSSDRMPYRRRPHLSIL